MRAWIIALIFILTTLTAVRAETDWEALSAGVVRVVAQKTPADTGAGFVIAKSADSVRVLTAFHVVKDARRVQVYFTTIPVPFPADLIGDGNESLDLAILVVKPSAGRSLPANLPAFVTRSDLRRGIPVWAMNSEGTPIPNTLTSLADGTGDTRFLLTTPRDVGDGFSGGPVFDDQGKLLGIFRSMTPGLTAAVVVKVGPALEALRLARETAPNLYAPSTGPGAQPIDPNYVLVRAGTVIMGCSPGDNECDENEKPPHRVTISKNFLIGKREVTLRAYKRFASPTVPSFDQTDDDPLVNVTWEEARAYCKWDGGGRLPTEAEWEFAARAGNPVARYGPLDDIAWYHDNAREHTQLVAQKKPNPLGLFDMLGNAWEWCADWYDKDYYGKSPSQDPPGPSTGELRSVRGGSWGNLPSAVRVSSRVAYSPNVQNQFVGFRCVRDVP